MGTVLGAGYCRSVGYSGSAIFVSGGQQNFL